MRPDTNGRRNSFSSPGTREATVRTNDRSAGDRGLLPAEHDRLRSTPCARRGPSRARTARCARIGEQEVLDAAKIMLLSGERSGSGIWVRFGPGLQPTEGVTAAPNCASTVKIESSPSRSVEAVSSGQPLRTLPFF